MTEPEEKFHFLLEKSNQESLLLFKHSRTCPISARAAAEVRAVQSAYPDVYLETLIVQEQRSLSNIIADRLNIRHESPQVIVLFQKRPVAVLNHFQINKSRIETILRSLSDGANRFRNPVNS